MAPKEAKKDDKKEEEKKEPTKKTLKNTPPEGVTHKQFHADRARRTLKVWDYKNNKKVEKKTKPDNYPEFLKLWQERTKAKANKRTPKRVKRCRIPQAKNVVPPKGDKKKKAKPKQYTKAERQLKSCWCWRKYKKEFGVYASMKSLVKFFVRHGKGHVKKEAVPAFVKHNYTKHMNLVDLIHQGRKRFGAHVGSFGIRHSAPQCVKQVGGPSLLQLFANDDFQAWKKKLVKEKKVSTITLAYAVIHIRQHGVLTADSKAKILAFAQCKKKKKGAAKKSSAKPAAKSGKK